MLPGDSNENRASSRSNGTAAATSIPLSPEMRFLSFANREALVVWLSFWKVNESYADERPLFPGWTPTRSLCSFAFSQALSDKAACAGVERTGYLDAQKTLQSSVFLNWVSLQITAIHTPLGAFKLVRLVLSKHKGRTYLPQL